MLISSIIRESPDKAKAKAKNECVDIGNASKDGIEAYNYHRLLTSYLIVKKYGKE
jgi:hypothetical protein